MPEKYEPEHGPTEEIKPKLSPEEEEKKYEKDARLGPIKIANAKKLEYQDKLQREKNLKKISKRRGKKSDTQEEIKFE